MTQVEEAVKKIPLNSPESSKWAILQRVATAYAQVGDFANAQGTAARLPEQGSLQSIALQGIVESLITFQQLSEAETLAQSISAPTQRILAFEKIAIAYHNTKQPNRADQFIRQAQQLAETDNSLPSGDFISRSLIEAYLQLGQRDTALQLAKTSLTWLQPEVMIAFSQAGQNSVVESWLSELLDDIETTSESWDQQSDSEDLIEQAIDTQQFEWISQEWNRIVTIDSGFGPQDSQMLRAATAYARTGQTEQAAAWAKQLPLSTRPVLRVKLLAAIALNAHQLGQTDWASSLMKETLESIDALVADYQRQSPNSPEQSSQIRSGALTALAVVYSQIGQTDLMSQLLQEISQLGDSIAFGDSLTTSFDVFWDAGQYVGALQIAQATNNQSTLSESAIMLTKQDRLDLALPIVDQLPQDGFQVPLLLAIAQRYGELQQVDAALPFLDKAFQLAQTVPGEESQFLYAGNDGTTELPIDTDRGSFLEAIALQHAQLKQTDRAVQVANRLQDASLRQWTLQAIQCEIQKQK